MVVSSGLHHISKRKRIYQRFEEYPHSKKFVRFLDNLLVIVAIIGPLLALPQVLKIFLLKNATGVSLVSWSSWLVLGIMWLIYGFVHKEKPIIIAYILWTIMHSLVVIGVLLYG